MSYTEAKTLFDDGDLLGARKAVATALESAKSDETYSLYVDVLVKLNLSAEAMVIAQDWLAASQANAHKSAQAQAWLAMASVHHAKEEAAENPSTPADVATAARKAVVLYEELGDKKGQATAMATLGSAMIRDGDSDGGMIQANKALELGKEIGETSILVSSLEAIIDGYVMQETPIKGLKIANEELFNVRKSGNKKAEAEVLEMISNAHAMLGEAQGAMDALKKALELYQDLKDKAGQGKIMVLMAQTKKDMGQMREATALAQDAVEMCKAAGSKGGESEALQTLSTVLVERGLGESAPKKPEAMKVLRALGRAVNARDEKEFKAYEAKLDSFGNVLPTEDISEFLGLLFEKDPGAMEFLEEHGWQFTKDEGGGQGGGDFKTRVRFFDHKFFYLNTIFGGMGFGPQFRSVNPRLVTMKADSNFAVSVSQMCETEAWQMELQWRPGYMDSGIQNGGTPFKNWSDP